jgi:hypothetical protein
LFRSPFGLKLAHSSNLSPNHLPPRYRLCCRPPIIFSLSALRYRCGCRHRASSVSNLKISLWLSTTDHLRKSADDPTYANMDSEEFATRKSAAADLTCADLASLQTARLPIRWVRLPRINWFSERLPCSVLGPASRTTSLEGYQ